MTCSYCRIALPTEAVYCHACGRKQTSVPAGHRRHRRPQHQGTITKLSGRKKPYWARMPADYSGGSVSRKSLGCFATKAEAVEALGRAMYAADQQNHVSTTLQAIYERFEAGHYFQQLSKSAQGSHRSAWKSLASCANIPISAVNKETFQQPINALHTQGLKRETLAKIRNLASLLCKEAMGLGLITVNYGQLVQLPKNDTLPPVPFTSSELKVLWAAADSGDKDAMVVQILNYTGMRPSELLSVDIAQHLHTEGAYWYFRTGSKTSAGENRIIPIPQLIHPLACALVAGRTSGPLVTTPTGKMWRLDNWRPRCFYPLMERLQLENHVPYSCRHTYADLQKRRNVSPEIMMTIMGHSDYGTTVERYQSTTSEDIARICAAANDLSRPE